MIKDDFGRTIIFIKNLPAKILTYLNNRFQVFLNSCTNAAKYNGVKLHYLDWEDDLVSLC